MGGIPYLLQVPISLRKSWVSPSQGGVASLAVSLRKNEAARAYFFLSLSQSLVVILAHTQQREEIIKLLRELSQEHLSSQANIGARQAAKQLLTYIEANEGDHEFLKATQYLLGKVAHEPSFSTERLASIYRRQGIACGKLNDYQQAIVSFNRALELDPTDAWTYRQRGYIYLILNDARQDYRQAIADFDRALELDPTDAWTHGRRGYIYMKLRSYQQAIAAFDRALELDPTDAWAYMRRGVCYRGLEDYQQALIDISRALELDPNLARAYFQRGVVYQRLEDYQQAIAAFDYALELNIQDNWTYVRTYDSRGLIYQELHDYHRAIENYDHALELDPTYARAYFHRGLAHLRLKNIEQARADFHQSWELDTSDIEAGWMAEWTGICQVSPSQSLAERLETIAAVDPQEYVSPLCRGVALLFRKRFEVSMRELEQAISLKPKLGDAYFWKGAVCASLGRDEEAIIMLEKALELELPPSLLLSLNWLEQHRLDFYEKHLVVSPVRF